MKKFLRRLSVLFLTICIGISLVSCGEKTPEAVAESQAEAILQESYDTVEIISHDTDWENLIDTFTFKGQVNYPYMIAKTTGTLAFTYNNNNKEWQRYEEVEQVISQDDEWLLDGEWQCNVKYGDEYADFYINISSYDGEVAECSLEFEGNCYLDEVHTINKEGAFTLEIVPGDWNEGELRVFNTDAKYLRLINYGDDPSGVSYSIIFDRKFGMVLHILNERFYFYWVYLEKVNA